MSPTPFQPDQPHRHHGPQPVKSNINNNNNNNNDNNNSNGCPSSLKIHKDSHAIKKSSSPTTCSSSGSVSSLSAPRIKAHQHGHNHQQRGPVIIYTHSPKVIHTHPKDFMSLVQKLTGMSAPEDHEVGPTNRAMEPPPLGCEKSGSTRGSHMGINDRNRMVAGIPGNANNNNNNAAKNSSTSDDNESSSVITDENCSSSTTTGDVVVQLNSCVGPPLFDPPAPAHAPGPLFPNLPFYNMQNSSSFDLLCSGPDPALYDYMDFNFSYNHMS